MPLPVLRLFRVTKNQPLADGIFALTLVPDDGELMFSFVAGQWVMLHLLNNDGTTWAKTAFSIASAPSESIQGFELAIKIYGDYTKRAATLKEGDVVKVQGPYGVFTLRPSTEPLILFAAGIGVTPFRSMIRELAATCDPRPVTLFYTNRTPALAAYESELRQLASERVNIHTIFIWTGNNLSSGLGGERGRLNESMMVKYIGDFSGKEYAMCGPKEFMDTIKDILIAHGVDVKARLRKELF
jgi:ferredoxin-NADP reductase